MTREQILIIINEFKIELKNIYGPRLKDIILYGSWARGSATEESDIDLLIILDGEVIPGKDIDYMIDIITDLNLQYNVLLSIYPVSEKDYFSISSPFLLTVKSEGVTV